MIGPFSSISTQQDTLYHIPQTRRAHFLLGHFSLWLSLWFLLSTKVRRFLRILRPGNQDMLMPSMTSGFAVCSQNCSATMRKPLLLKGCKDEEISFCVSVGGSLNSTSMVGVLHTIIQESKLAVREASNRIIQPSSWVCFNLFQEQYGTSRGHGSQPCEFHGFSYPNKYLRGGCPTKVWVSLFLETPILVSKSCRHLI